MNELKERSIQPLADLGNLMHGKPRLGPIFEMYKKERTQGPHNQEQKVGDTQRILKGAAAGGTWRM